jgi:hypothetical protein
VAVPQEMRDLHVLSGQRPHVRVFNLNIEDDIKHTSIAVRTKLLSDLYVQHY